MSTTTPSKVEYFSHPLCSGCNEVLDMLLKLEKELGEEIELTRWTLAIPAGRVRAEALGVTEVPTVVVGERDMIVGVPGSIDELRRRLLAPSVG